VVTVADLVPDARPEDVVVVADRLRREPFTFLLVGDGTLACSVRDLMSFLAVDALQLRLPRHPIEELVAVADVVLDPSCEPVVRPLVAAALAAGTPVVTAPGGGAERLVAEIGGGIVVNYVGDPDELAAALRPAVSGLRPSAERAQAVLASQRQVGATRSACVARGTNPAPRSDRVAGLLFSVAMPTYNRRDALACALAAWERQGPPDLPELVVVDDGSD
jgi:hypothetical protein